MAAHPSALIRRRTFGLDSIRAEDLLAGKPQGPHKHFSPAPHPVRVQEFNSCPIGHSSRLVLSSPSRSASVISSPSTGYLSPLSFLTSSRSSGCPVTLPCFVRLVRSCHFSRVICMHILHTTIQCNLDRGCYHHHTETVSFFIVWI